MWIHAAGETGVGLLNSEHVHRILIERQKKGAAVEFRVVAVLARERVLLAACESLDAAVRVVLRIEGDLVKSARVSSVDSRTH